MKRAVTWTAAVLGMVLMLTGCAEDTQSRIQMLSDQNQSLMAQNQILGQQRNRLQELLGASEQQLSDFQARLASSMGDADALRTQMATMPVPQEVAPGWTPVPGGAMIAIPGELLFESGKAELRKDAMRRLDSIVSTIQSEYGAKDVIIFGHTDNTPIKKSKWKDNYQLSSERAMAVLRHMMQAGISPRRMVASGCGQYRPRQPNSTEQGRSVNRRVEIYAVELGALLGQ